MLEHGADVNDERAVEALLPGIEMDIRYENGMQQIYVSGKNVTPYLREPHMSKAASDVSALPCVRYKMVELQREFAASHDVVLDGRDIGTFVLPDADINKRDYNDSHRAVAPLKQAEDAVRIDTTDMSIEQVTECVERIVKEKTK